MDETMGEVFNVASDDITFQNNEANEENIDLEVFDDVEAMNEDAEAANAEDRMLSARNQAISVLKKEKE